MRTATPTIDDLITRGIPGAIVTTSIIITITGLDTTFPDSNFALIGFLAISYTVGTFLDLHKHDIFSAPPHFRQVLYNEKGNEEYLGRLTQIGLNLRNRSIVSRINNSWFPVPISQNPDYGRDSIFSDNGASFIEAINENEGIHVSPEGVTESWLEFERSALKDVGRVGENQHTVYHFLLNFFTSIIIAMSFLFYGIIVSSSVSVILLSIAVLAALTMLLIEINLFGRYSDRYSVRLMNVYYYSTVDSDTEKPEPNFAS